MPNKNVLSGITAKNLFDKELGLSTNSVKIVWNFILPRILARTNRLEKISAAYYDLIEQLYIGDVLGESAAEFTLDPSKARGTNKALNRSITNIEDGFINVMMYYFATALTDRAFKAVFPEGKRTQLTIKIKTGTAEEDFTYFAPPQITSATDKDLLSFLDYILTTYLSSKAGGEPANKEIREEWKAVNDYLELVSTGKVKKKKIQDKDEFISDLKLDVSKEEFPKYLETLRTEIAKIPGADTDKAALSDYIKPDGDGSKESPRIALPKIASLIWDLYSASVKGDPTLKDDAERRNVTNIKVEDFFDDVKTEIAKKVKGETEAKAIASRTYPGSDKITSKEQMIKFLDSPELKLDNTTTRKLKEDLAKKSLSEVYNAALNITSSKVKTANPNFTDTRINDEVAKLIELAFKRVGTTAAAGEFPGANIITGADDAKRVIMELYKQKLLPDADRVKLITNIEKVLPSKTYSTAADIALKALKKADPSKDDAVVQAELTKLLEPVLKEIEFSKKTATVSQRFDSPEQFSIFLDTKPLSIVAPEIRQGFKEDVKIKNIDDVFTATVAEVAKQVKNKLSTSEFMSVDSAKLKDKLTKAGVAGIQNAEFVQGSNNIKFTVANPKPETNAELDKNLRKLYSATYKATAPDKKQPGIFVSAFSKKLTPTPTDDEKFRALSPDKQAAKIQQDTEAIVKAGFLEVSTPDKWKELSKAAFKNLVSGFLKGTIQLGLMGLGRTRSQASATAGKIAGGARSAVSNIKKFVRTPTGKGYTPK